MTEVNARHSANLYGSDVWVLGLQCPGLNPSPATSQLGDSGQGLGKESSSTSQRTNVRMKRVPFVLAFITNQSYALSSLPVGSALVGDPSPHFFEPRVYKSGLICRTEISVPTG